MAMGKIRRTQEFDFRRNDLCAISQSKVGKFNLSRLDLVAKSWCEERKQDQRFGFIPRNIQERDTES